MQVVEPLSAAVLQPVLFKHWALLELTTTQPRAASHLYVVTYCVEQTCVVVMCCHAGFQVVEVL